MPWQDYLWIVPHLKALLLALASKIAAQIAPSGGGGTLPTEAQLKKMGPQVEYTRGYPGRGDW